MKLVDQITAYAFMLVLLMAICALLAAVFVISRHKRLKQVKEEENCRDAKTRDAEGLVPIEDVADDMIIHNGRKRFVAVIRCRGYDFYTANVNEKIRTKNNYCSFISGLTSRITYRLYGEDIDMEHTMKMYQDQYDQLQEKAFHESETFREARAAFLSAREEDPQQAGALGKFLRLSERKITAYNWRLSHLESQMGYISHVSGPAAGRQRLVQTYVIDWECKDGFVAGTLTEEQLHQKAAKELNKMCRVKIRQLNDAGVKASRCGTGELIDMLHHHYHPISANRYGYEQLGQSTYYDLVSTTDTVEQMDSQYEDELIQELMAGGDAYV